MIIAAFAAQAQESSNTGVRRRAASESQDESRAPGVTDRMKQRYDGNSSLSEGDTQWMRVIYRQIDLDKDKNAALYFPEDLVDGQENLFRIIMRLLANGDIPAYEYLDGREVFTDQYKVKVRELLDRYYIFYTEAKGSTEKNPKFAIDESDVPTTEVLSYYVIERWEFDNRNNRMKRSVEAICPVLHRSGDFGGEALKYPMFWVKYSDLRPHLAQQAIFVSDDNNLPTFTYDDYFNLAKYEGDIYKTRNLRNKSMMQLYPDPDDMRRAQDSIQARLDSFEEKLWVPNREDIIAAREAREAASDTLDVLAASDKKVEKKRTATRQTRRATSDRKATKVKKPKSSGSSSSGGSSNAARSVRKRK